MAEAKANNQWLGSVLGALILVGGYVAYQEWNKGSEHDRMCASLKRQFQTNFDAIVGSGVIERSKQAGNQSPMHDVAGDVAANSEVMRTLDAQCPGWQTKQYD
jgi:hypothetical protein